MLGTLPTLFLVAAVYAVHFLTTRVARGSLRAD
jgi:hypothetical protein